MNDPDTAKYYERIFEIVKNSTQSISKGTGLSWDARITKGEKEVPKRRVEVFFRLKQGEFIVFADVKDTRVQFELQKIDKGILQKNICFKVEDLILRVHL